MTTLSKAIKEAGIAIPVNKRIWQWLKDNGSHTGAEVSAALNIPLSASSSVLSQMASRKMVTIDKKFSKHVGRNISYYGASGRVFVVLPVPKKIVQGQCAEVLLEPQPQKTKVESILDSLSVVDAFDMYKRLEKMFNQKE